MTDLIREVDEELRAERALRLWKTYGKYVIGAAVLVVAVTAAVVVWKDQQRKSREADGERFAAALALAYEGKVADAGPAFAAIAKDGGAGYRALAGLHEAALKTRAGDTEGAIAVYDALAADSGLPSEMRDLATALSILNALDTVDPEAAAKRIEPLAKDGQVWRFTARELLAALALRRNDAPRAKELYKSLADDADSPPALRARATEMLSGLGG